MKDPSWETRTCIYRCVIVDIEITTTEEIVKRKRAGISRARVWVLRHARMSQNDVSFVPEEKMMYIMIASGGGEWLVWPSVFLAIYSVWEDALRLVYMR